MLRRAIVPMLAFSLATMALAAPVSAKWPPWLSIESPVNPFDRTTRGALLLVHATVREGTTSVADLSGTAEGIVAGARRSVAFRFDTTSRPGVYAVTRQWPSEGDWLLRITLLGNTTALVTLDRFGQVSGVSLPTQAVAGGRIPRPVTTREIDSTLAVLTARR